MNWISVEDRLPERKEHPFYGKRYSIPVLICNDLGLWESFYSYDYNMKGWVESNLRYGPNPSDYGYGNVIYWARPEPPK